MGRRAPQRNWFWLTLTLSSITVIAVVLALWELIQNHFFRNLDYITLHYLYITRGIAVSLLLAFWAAWFVLRERKDKEDQLRRSSERYRAILDASPSAVLLFNRGLVVSECNFAAEKLYGFTKEELIGAPLPTVSGDQRRELEALLDDVASGKPVLDVETRRSMRNGRHFDVQLSLLPFHEAGEQLSFLEVTSDIGERVRLRETLLHIEKLTAMGQMAAGTAHHLNTPLASMLLRLRMMREGRFEGSLTADLERLDRSVAFCQHFVQELLRFSRTAPMRKQPESLAATLQSVASFLSPQLLAKRIQLALEINGINGAMVLADRNQLEALFLILLMNAADAVAAGGVIRIDCSQPASGIVQVSVTDNGCGIDREILPHIFEPFFTTKPPGSGTGLGLAIANNILQSHGGTVRFDSAPQSGTTAFVELPLCGEPATAAGAK
jgi:two-component system, sporulation sensor kinase E